MKLSKSHTYYYESWTKNFSGLSEQAKQIQRRNAPAAIQLYEQAYQIAKDNKMEISYYEPIIHRLLVLYRRIGKNVEEIVLLRNVIEENSAYEATEKWIKRLDKKLLNGQTSNWLEFKNNNSPT